MKTSAFLALLILSATAHEGRSQDLYFGGFNGTWQGKFKSSELDLKSFAPLSRSFDLQQAIQIKGTAVHVLNFSAKDRKWEEIKPNQFRIETHKTNAIVYAINSAADVMGSTNSGGWVETWNYTITHKDKDNLYVYFTRAVNNYLVPLGADNARFFYAGGGEFRRVN